MHIADALISPAVGGAFWAASGYLAAVCAKRLHNSDDGDKTALMGVLAAFVFASQMINFTIPATGSSGHIGGGLLLAIFLGPERAFLSMVSILAVQCLFFADGGLLALGCNIFNLGFFPCFIAYPFIYKKITEKYQGKSGVFWGAVITTVIGLELGAIFVVIETALSGIASIPVALFIMLMLPIHLAVGAVEGVGTALIVTYIYTNAPEVMEQSKPITTSGTTKKVVVCFMLLAVLLGGIFALYASSFPDGLEWSINKITGREELIAPATYIHTFAAHIQKKIVPLPDYTFMNASGKSEHMGTSISGIAGGLLTLLMAAGLGLLFRRRRHIK